MYKILFTFFICFILITQSHAWFNNTFTNVTSERTFSKTSWVDELKVSEDYFINPFSWDDIKKNTTICTWNNCPCWFNGCSFTTSYSVNGVLFGPNHPKFKRAYQSRRNSYNYADGIISRVEYRQNTFTRPDWVYMPRQSVKVRRYYTTTYRHDTSTPTCGEVNYYNDESLSEPFTYEGWWLNQPKYFTMKCLDSQTGCYCAPDDENCIIVLWEVVSTPQLLGHKIKPKVSFTNRVRLTDNSCEPGGSFREVLFDLRTPKFDILVWWDKFNLNQENLRDYKIEDWKKLDGLEVPWKLEFTRTWSINRKAWDTIIDIELEDSYLSDSIHGVSWIRDYTFRIERLTNSSFEDISSEIVSSCERSWSFSEYNSNWELNSSDVRNFSFDCSELRTAWKYNFILTANDWAWNSSVWSSIVNIYPEDINIANSSITVTNPDSIKYANNIDTIDYTLDLNDQYWNPIFNKTVVNPIHSIDWYSGGNQILLLNSNSALRYSYPASQTDNVWKYSFSVRSLLPGSLTHRFVIKYTSWDNSYVETWEEKILYITNNNIGQFEKPFSADIVFQWPWDAPESGTEQNYRINILNDWNISAISFPNLVIDANSLNFSSGHRFSQITSLDSTFALDDLQCSFTGIFDATSASSVLESPVMEINDMDVRYTLAWQSIRYPLDSFGVSWCSVSTLGLKTIGSTQWDWKWEITWWDSNFSDVSTSQLRSQIRQNAYSLIRGLNSWDVVNGVRYIEWDVTLSWDQNYETLVVKNGNVFISWDLNTSEKTFWILVVKDDWYDITSDFNNQGNIYIWNTVENINAHLYADGAFRSSDQNGWEYSDALLWNKLRMKWSLFTRNTIWWWVLAGSNYVLPWGTTTINLSLASTYDLNYIRRAQVCWEVDDYSFLVEYDSTIQTNPPKWFQTN